MHPEQDHSSFDNCLWEVVARLFTTLHTLQDALLVFASLHQKSIAKGDEDGAFWALWHIQALIAQLCGPTGKAKKEELTKVYYNLIHCRTKWLYKDENANEDFQEQEKVVSKAWATFYVGSTAWVCGMGKKIVTNWLWKSIDFWAELSDPLYTLCEQASSILGDAYLHFDIEQDDLEQAVRCYGMQSEAAVYLSRDAKLEALANYCIGLSKNDEFERAKDVIDEMKLIVEESRDPTSLYFKGLILRTQGALEFMTCQYVESEVSNIRAVELLGQLPVCMWDCYRAFMCEQKKSILSPHKMVKVVQCILVAWREISMCREYQCNIDGSRDAKQKLLQLLEQYRHDGILDVILGWAMAMQKLTLLSRDALDSRRLNNAKTAAQQLLQLAQQHMNPKVVVEALIILSSIAKEEGMANDNVESLLRQAEELVQENSANHRIILNELGGLYFRSGRWNQAVEMLEQHAQQIVMLDKKFGRFSSARIAYNEQAKEVFHCLQMALLELDPPRVKQALVWAERERARDLLYRSNKATLKDSCEFDKDYSKAWNEIKSISKVAGGETVFIVYTIHSLLMRDEYSLVSYLLHAGKVRCNKQEASTLQGLVYGLSCFFLSVKQGTHVQGTIDCLHELYKILLQPWSTLLDKIAPKRLVIIPTEILSLIPFGALVITKGVTEENDDEGDDDRILADYIIQKYVISYAPSLRMFQHCEERQKVLTSEHPYEALVVANPDKSLPKAEAEGEFVRGILKKVGVNKITYIGSQNEVNPEELLNVLPQQEWVHIASHVVIDKDLPRGGIQLYVDQTLSPEEQRKSRKVLTAENVEQAPALLEARGVVLSACESALGENCSEGTLGLARSMHLAGVPMLMVSLWEVADCVTDQLMVRLYNRLSNGIEASTALCNVMKEMAEEKEDEDDDESEPKFRVYEWAPFIVSGSISARLTNMTDSHV